MKTLSRTPSRTVREHLPAPRRLTPLYPNSLKRTQDCVTDRFHPKVTLATVARCSWGEAEPMIFVAVIRTVVVPVRRTTAGGVVDPRAAAKHAGDGRRRRRRPISRTDCRRFGQRRREHTRVVTSRKPVLIHISTPLPHIAVHILKAKSNPATAPQERGVDGRTSASQRHTAPYCPRGTRIPIEARSENQIALSYHQSLRPYSQVQ
jgi:hypothetical protein